MTETAAWRPSIALSAYAEPLIAGRRVLVFGNALSDLPFRLLERGARLIQVYDADTTRVAEAATRNSSRNVSFAPLAEGGMSVREGVFDAAIVEDISAYGEPATVMRRLHRALTPRGTALIAMQNPDVRERLLEHGLQTAAKLDYYGLYDLVAQEFEQVRMLGQVPFLGYAVVDFAPEGDPEPAIDTGFLSNGAEEPDYFVALAGNHQGLEEFSVVQLPWRQIWETAKKRLPSTPRSAGATPTPSSRLSELTEKLGTEPRREKPGAPADQLEKLRAQLAQKETWIHELEARADTADERADATQSELEELRERTEAQNTEQQQRLAAKQRELEQLQRELDQLRSELETTRHRAQSAVQEAESSRRELAEAQSELTDTQSELTRAERELAEARATLTPLQEKVAGDAALRGELGSLQQRLAAEQRRQEAQSSELVSVRNELSRLEGERSRLQEELRLVQPQVGTLERQLEAERRQLEAERQQRADIAERLQVSERRLAELTAAAEISPSDDVGTLEGQLKERSREIRRLQRDVAEAERIGRELVRELAAASSLEPSRATEDQAETGDLERKLNALAQLNAEREAELAATRWALAALEVRLREADAAAQPS